MFFRQQQQINRRMKSQGFDRVRFNRNQEKLIFSSASMKTLPLPNKTQLKSTHKRLITVPLAKKEQEEKTYEWRTKTEFPIARILQFWVRQSKCTECIFEVQVEDFSVRLADLQNISLFKMLYLLKEALIGFERLFHMYGPFVLTSRMVALNKADKCKVWLADDFASNACTPAHFTQQGFLAMLFRLFEQKGNKLKSTRVFFQQLTQCSSFCGALAFFEEYAKANKITILSSCRFTPQEIIQRKGFQGTRTMNQAPRSLATIPLRTSFDHESKNPLLDVLPSFVMDPEQISMKMKNSDETAAEAFSKKSNGLDPEDQFFLESSLLNNQEPSEPLAKSQLQAKGKPNINFIRKFSEQSPCLTPSKSKGSLGLHPKLPRSRWNYNSFVNCQVQQKGNYNNVFNLHKWEKTLNGLFCNSEEQYELKKSFHQGKEQRMTEQKFHLLDKFGKDIKQSFIHEDDLNQN